MVREVFLDGIDLTYAVEVRLAYDALESSAFARRAVNAQPIAHVINENRNISPRTHRMPEDQPRQRVSAMILGSVNCKIQPRERLCKETAREHFYLNLSLQHLLCIDKLIVLYVVVQECTAHSAAWAYIT